LPQTALIGDVAALFATRTRADWDATLSQVDCCYHPVLAYDEVAENPHVAARGFVRREESAPSYTEVMFPAIVDDAPPPPRRPMREVSLEEALTAWSLRA
jgi:crotonobetainyl-CoA:carnitine CoA-transferase CaiB-like acyl-CoA transferase